MTSGKPYGLRVLLAGVPDGITDALAYTLEARGHQVVAQGVASRVQPLPPPNVVVFAAPDLDERGVFAADDAMRESTLDAIELATNGFLRDVQACTKAMLATGGQVWVLGLDDSFGYYLDIPVCPAATNARVACLRAMAKEYARFGLTFNAVIVQPTPETAGEGAFKRAAGGLKSYALKYRPASAQAFAATLVPFFEHPALPVNGATLHFGVGVNDHNF